ncbi:MAG: HEAT repeat domain-containing protein [Bacteroidales bacterium]|nr:HEAT repeat domain-containing protein [Bacteroidales bacterium]
MKRNFLNNAGLLLLAIVFSTGLIFAFIELPRLLDAGLQSRFGFPQFDQGGGGKSAFKTEMFIEGLHLRWIGYGSLLLIVGLIIFGYTTRRSGWALAGAVGLFIPVFGQFALSMFFLAGLGFLRVGWLPFLEVSSFDLLDLGKVIYVPYWILIWFFELFKWNAHNFLTWFFMASGAFLFTWGVLLWFRSRYGGEKVASVWIYKISRHPQYLGWILWSYGFILFTPFINDMKKSWAVPSSLPWLLMTMTIVGICMIEEIKMMEITGGDYQQYRKSSPFLVPLPRWLNRITGWPGRLVTKGEYPARRSQVLWIVLIYTGIFIALSLFWVDFDRQESGDVPTSASQKELSEIVISLEEAGENRRAVSALMKDIPSFGAAGTDSLLALATHPNPIIREFAIMHMGQLKIREGEEIYILSMYDSTWRVRGASIIAVGEIRSEMAVDSLIGMLVNPRMKNNLFHIYGALGSIGNDAAIPYLAKGLDGGEHYNQISALNAIMQIDPDAGISHAISELKDENVHVRRNAVIVCIQSGDQQVVEPLKKLMKDEDFEVRFYAKQGLKKLEPNAPQETP